MSVPFRFGVQTLRSFESRRQFVDLVRKVEDLGYWNLTVPDHFHDYLAPTVALMAAADATTSLRLGAMVWCNDYRHPAVLAKEAATLDLLSEGRLEIGIGAGWMRDDYDQSGLTYDPPGTRVDRFVEAIEIFEGLLTGERFSFGGAHYRITDLANVPRTVQRPRPPFFIGGGGPRMLRIAGRHADVVGLNPNLRSGVLDPRIAPDLTAARFAEKVHWVREGAGDRFDALELHVFCLHLEFTGAEGGALPTSGLAGRLGLTSEQAMDSPIALVGTPKQMAETLVARRERLGISRITVGSDHVEAFAPVVARLAGT